VRRSVGYVATGPSLPRRGMVRVHHLLVVAVAVAVVAVAVAVVVVVRSIHPARVVFVEAKWWYQDVWESDGWDVAAGDGPDDAAAAAGGGAASSGIDHPRTQKYRTVPPSLLPALRMSMPAYDFLRTLTPAYRRRRAVSTPPSGRLYEDPRNEHVFVFVGAKGGGGRGRIVPRDMAGVSPFDSSVQGGDATWGESSAIQYIEKECIDPFQVSTGLEACAPSFSI
jgi:hypothetical protein